MSGKVDSVVYRAESLLALKRTGQAEALVRGALAEQPAEPQLLLQLARILNAQHRWAEVIIAAEAALAVRSHLVEAQGLLAWSAYQLDRWDLLARHVSAALAEHPQDPLALMCLALGGFRDRSAEGRERIREHYRLALEHSGGDAWYVLQAAEIEACLGSSAQAQSLIDDALERLPTDEGLLVAKAKHGATPVEMSFGIVRGLLAASPTDTRLRLLFDTLVAQRRRRLLAMLWLTPALGSLGVMLLDGRWQGAWVFGVFGAGVLTWCVRMAALQDLPPAVQAELASKAPWRRVTRHCARISVWTGALGTALLAIDIVLGAWIAVAALPWWVATRLASLAHERTQSRRADAELAAAAGAPGTGDHGPRVRELVDGRSSQAPVTFVFLLPFAALALVPMASPVEEGARATLGVVTAVVALLAYAEGRLARWGDPAPARDASVSPARALLGTVLVVGLPVGIMTWLLVASVGTLESATAEWLALLP